MRIGRKYTEISLKKAAMINASAKYSNVLLMLVANAVLARLLSPEEYGVLAIVNVFITFFSVFSDMGFSAGVIQNKDLSEDDIDHIFSFSVHLGVILSLLFCVVGYLTAIMYDNKEYIKIGYLLSIAVFFNTVNMVPNAKMLRDKQFILVALRSVVAFVISYIIAIYLAFHGFSYYSLVAQSIVSAVIIFIWNYVTTRLKFHVKFRFASLETILSYSAYNFFYDFLNYLGRNLDNILTGKLMGSQALGYYNKAYQLMLYPVHYLSNVITPVLHPILSEYQNSKDVIYDKFIKILKCLSLIGVFATVICVSCAEEIVLILYGANWVEAIPCVTILGTTIWFQMVTSTYTSIFKSLGDTKHRFQSGVLYVAIQMVMIIVGVLSGDIRILSVYVAISFVLRFFVECYFLITKAFKASIVRFFCYFAPEVLFLIFLVVIMGFANHYLQLNNALIQLMVKSLICGVSYLAMIVVTKQAHYIMEILPRRFRLKIRGNKHRDS